MRCLLSGVVAGLLLSLPAARLEAAVRVALLQTDPKQTANIVALVEARLSAGGKVTLVERQQIDKVLQEQQLQTVLSADAVTGRVSIGKILQADLLVFLQFRQKPERHLDVVISETHQGLRLVHMPLALTDAEAGVAALTGLVHDAIDKQSLKSPTIIAVPPFVSRDLGFDYDYLKNAYAKLVEATVSRQRGVLVVEFDEARALGKEILLSSGNDVSRPLPLYMMGQYRTDNAKDGRRVSIQLKLVRGEKELATALKKEMTLEQGTAFLRESADSFLAKTPVGPQAPADPRVEAALLAKREALLLSFGSWREALDLIEASLLLNPNQPPLYRDALVATYHILEESKGRGALPNAAPIAQDARVHYAQRGYEHMELFFRGNLVDYQRDINIVEGFLHSIGILPDVQVSRQMLDRFIAAYFRVLDEKARNKVIDDSALFLTHFERISAYSDDKRREINEKVMREFVYLPKAGQVFSATIFAMSYPGHIFDAVHNPKDREFLEKVAALPHPEVQLRARGMLNLNVAARENWKKIENAKYWADRAREEAAAKGGPNSDVVFTRLALTVDGVGKDSAPPQVDGWLAVGNTTDVLWNREGIFVMKKPGLMRLINDSAPGHLDQHQSDRGVFDGKYVWFTRIQEGDQVELLVLDPVHETVEQIGTKQGLPRSSKVQIAPLSPGRVMVVGYFGRAYAADVQYAPSTEPKIKVIHEFRRTPNKNDAKQRVDPEMVFTPGAPHSISGKGPDGRTRRMVLISRGSHESWVSLCPILIDADSGAVMALDVNRSYYYCEPALNHDGACYALGLGPRDIPVIRRFGIAGVADRPTSRFGIVGVTERPAGQVGIVGAVGPPPGAKMIRDMTSLVEFGGMIHFVHPFGWAIASPDEGSFHELKAAMPQTKRGVMVVRSEHFGLVAWIIGEWKERTGEDLNVYRVQFAKPLARLSGK